jgi:hypothetical protein
MRFSVRAAAAISAVLLVTATVAASTWPSVSYAEVRAYAYNPKNKFPHKDRSGRVVMYEELISDGKLAKNAVNKSGQLLRPAQVNRLIRAVTEQPRKVSIQARCFDPHHGFVFYDGMKRPAAWVEVCFKCNTVSTHPIRKSSTDPDMQALLTLCDELKLPRTP